MEARMIAPKLDAILAAAPAPHADATVDRNSDLPSITPRCDATIDIDHAAATRWDVTVIGAGPAGALAARQAAQCGLRTLLIEKSPFPRSKVCGGCISGAGRHVLQRVGLGRLVEEPAATSLDRFDLTAFGKRVSLSLPVGAAVSRFHFDAALVRAAIGAGAEFLSETTAVVGGLTNACRFRTVELQSVSRRSVKALGRMVIVADGLGRASMKRHRHFAPQIAAASRIGLGATVSAAGWDLEPGVVSMCVGRSGYAGLVKVPNNSVNVAAAVDSNLVRAMGPAVSVRMILLQAGVKPPTLLDDAEWRGTGLLTRRAGRICAKRILLIGDAAGYVEPFTGEGMTWAMASAAALGPLVAEWLRERDRIDSRERTGRDRKYAELSSAWSALHRRRVRRRQASCRALSGILRRPWAVRAVMEAISKFPGVARPWIHYFWNRGEHPSPDASETTRIVK
jgi:menaquinone-9 beta-reductase